jgi:predicted transcriptional regulator
VNQLGRTTGQAERLRTVTPRRLFLAIVSALAGADVESLADLLRTFNDQNGVQVAYKAFYNRLARLGFATFMRGMCLRLIEQLRLQTRAPEGQRALARFKDIVIHDASSFALKSSLREAFPGRFTTIEPAAVEIHATDSGCADEVRTIHLTPDCDAERQFLPDPATPTGRMLLADRGYPSVPHFEAVADAGGAFIVRLTRSYDSWVGSAWIDGRRLALPTRRRLSRVLAEHAGCQADLDVSFVRGRRVARFRVVMVPGRDEAMTRLYRFRWQIELCFKEWKSYANLHTVGSSNPHIAEGPIWASLCAAILKRFLAHAAHRVPGGFARSGSRRSLAPHKRRSGSAVPVRERRDTARGLPRGSPRAGTGRTRNRDGGSRRSGRTEVPMRRVGIQTLRSLIDEMKAVARDERPAPANASAPSFESVAALVGLLTPENRRLLNVIRDRRPQSVTALSRVTARAQPNLTRTLAKLEATGLISMTSHGRCKAQTVVVQRIVVEIDPCAERDRLLVA